MAVELNVDSMHLLQLCFLQTTAIPSRCLSSFRPKLRRSKRIGRDCVVYFPLNLSQISPIQIQDGGKFCAIWRIGKDYCLGMPRCRWTHTSAGLCKIYEVLCCWRWRWSIRLDGWYRLVKMEEIKPTWFSVCLEIPEALSRIPVLNCPSNRLEEN